MTKEQIKYKLNEVRMMINDGEHIEEQNILVECIKALEQQPSEDCENNDGECCRLLFEKSFNKDCVSRQKCKEGMIKYGFHAPDMTVTEFIEDELPPVTPKIPISEDYVSLGVYKQVMWERDIAIEQLKELSYSFGEKIRTSNDCVSRADLLAQINESWETIETKLDFVNIVKASPSVTSKVHTLDDCVSREQALLALTGINLHLMNAEELIVLFDKRIKALPPITPTQRWIPVSEKLPEDRNIVLVTAYWHETYQVMEASYYGDGLWWCVPFNNCGDHMKKLNPKAWQPLPQPYEEKRGN